MVKGDLVWGGVVSGDVVIVSDKTPPPPTNLLPFTLRRVSGRSRARAPSDVDASAIS